MSILNLFYLKIARVHFMLKSMFTKLQKILNFHFTDFQGTLTKYIKLHLRPRFERAIQGVDI